MYDEDEEVGPAGTFESYKAEGDQLYKNGMFSVAIQMYDTALEMRPGDSNCLVSRSKCNLQLGETKQALIDAEASLAENNQFHKGIFQKAEAMYNMGEFEMALVFYHRGHKMRPELQEFRLGIQKAREAIDNAVGSPNKVQLTTEGDLSFFTKQAETKRVTKRPGLMKEATRQANSSRYEMKSAAKDASIRQLLGELYGDRVFLENLMRESYSSGTSNKSDKDIQNLALGGIKYLDNRTEFWRQQKPVYVRRREKLERMGKKAYQPRPHDPNQYMVQELEKIDEDLSHGRTEEALRKAVRSIKTVNSWPEDTLNNRHEVVASLHRYAGNAHMELGRLEKALEHHEVDLEISRSHGLEDARSLALDNIGRVHARRGDYRKAVDVWESKIDICKSELEKTWLFHELGQCYLELKELEKARDFGEKAITAARAAKDDVWIMNCSVLTAQAELKLDESQLALEHFEQALDLSKVVQDVEAEAAITRAIKEVNAKIVAGETEQKVEEDSPRYTEPESEPEPPPPPQREEPKESPKTTDVEETAGETTDAASETAGETTQRSSDEEVSDEKRE